MSAEYTAETDYIGPPRRPCRHPSLDDECRACRIERRAHNNAVDALSLSHVDGGGDRG